MTTHERFLKLLDFSETERRELLPLWENACALFRITEAELQYAMQEWIPQYWDLSLRGVRRCIGVYIRELIEISRLPEYRARGDRLLYYNMPCHPACIYANKLAGNGRLHASYPDYFIATVFNAFLHKSMAPASQNGVCASPVCHQCGMNRVKADTCFRNLIAEPTVLWNWGLYCNEGHKIEELVQNMGARNWKYVLTVIPQDAGSGVAEADDESRVNYLARELRESLKSISAYTGIEVREEHLLAATKEYLTYQLKVEQLMDLMSRAPVQPVTGNDLTIFQAPSQIAFDSGYRFLDEAIDIMLEEVRERVDRKEGTLPENAPRLACHFVPFSVPWINKAFLDCGINLSVNTFFALASRQRDCFDEGDVYRSIARQWLSNPSVVNMQNETDLVCEILEKYPQDGVLYGFFNFSCWIGSLEKTMIQIVERRTGIPHYYFESEFWNDEQYSLEDRLTRIRGIAYNVKIHRMVSGWNHGT